MVPLILSYSGSVTNNFEIIICLLFFKETLGDLVLAIGTLLGSTSGLIFLFVVAYKRDLIILHKPDLLSSNIKIMFTQLPAKITSSLLVGINPFVDQFFSAQLVIGSIAALNYGIKTR